MRIKEVIVLGILGLIIASFLIACPFDDIAAFDPVGWLNDSINSFVDLFFGLLLKNHSDPSLQLWMCEGCKDKFLLKVELETEKFWQIL
jgi:hypothetical protein